MKTIWKNTTPEPPYYAVIFISEKSDQLGGYEEMDKLLMQQAHQQPGFLGYSSATGMFISYWQDQPSIERWRQHSSHLQAKEKAFQQWYNYFHSMICRVESSRIFERHLNKLI